MKTRDLLALLALSAIWGASYLFIRIAVPSLGPFPLAGGRVALAALVLWSALRLARQRPVLRPHMRELLILGALNAAIPFSLIGVAELYVTASLAAMLTATAPAWSAVFSTLWIGERTSPSRAAGLLLGVVGVGVLVGWSPMTMTPPVLLSIVGVLIATASYALATVYAKRYLSGIPAPTLALGQQVGATALLAIPALVRAPSSDPTTASLAALVALAIVCTAVAYLLFFRLVASIGPTRVSTVTYLIPVFGTLWGAVFLGEPVSGGMVAGLVLVLASVVLVNEVPIGRMFRGRSPAACTE